MKPFSSRYTVPIYFAAAVLSIWAVSLHFVDDMDPATMKFVLPLIFPFAIAFIILAVREVWGSPRISSNEKWMWTIVLIAFSLISGLVYSLMGRERVVEAY